MAEPTGPTATSNGTQRCSEIVSALPGLVRIGVASWLRTVQWAANTVTNTASQLINAAATGQPSASAHAPVVAPRPIDVPPVATTTPPTNNGHTPPPEAPARSAATIAALRARGAKLLYDSADVWFEDDTHPAYARILDELSPDEARILRFLAIDGAQPSIDVRTHRPLGVGSELVAGGLSMIGVNPGVRNLARTKADLNNLYRLGLVWFSREPVDDPTRYQVVEVQPDVLEVLKEAGRSPKTVHRSIHLTPFGEDFCAVCLPLDVGGGNPSR